MKLKYRSDPKPTFRQISKGCGGTLWLSPRVDRRPSTTFKALSMKIKNFLKPKPDIDHSIVGFKDCNDSVGVYFRVDGRRCFAAHINAYLQVPANGTVQAQQQLDAQQASALKDAIQSALTDEACRANWPQDIRTSQAATVHLCCAQPGSSSNGIAERGLNSAAQAIKEAVSEWFLDENVMPSLVMKHEATLQDGRCVSVLNPHEVRLVFGKPIEECVGRGGVIWEWRGGYVRGEQDKFEWRRVGKEISRKDGSWVWF